MKEKIEMLKKIEEFKRVITFFSNDLSLELKHPKEFNISKMIKNDSNNIIKDIDILNELDFMLRHDLIDIVYKEDSNENK